MITCGLPIAATLFIWWFSTGAILFLDGLPKRTFRISMGAATILAFLACYGLYATKADDNLASVYIAFVSSMMLWAWNEMAFLMGYITGSRREVCPESAKGLDRFFFATQSIIHHEFALLASGLLILALTWSGVNQFGFYTFLLLFIMRLSTKLNIFLGVPNATINFLPEHLAYLKSYFAIKPMNLLFPLSVSVATWAAIEMIGNVSASPLGSGIAAGNALLATLMVLAIIEHWFLVIPLPFGEIWSWGLSSRRSKTKKLGSRQESETEDINPAVASARLN